MYGLSDNNSYGIVKVYAQPIDTGAENKFLTCWYLKWRSRFARGCLVDVIFRQLLPETTTPKLWGWVIWKINFCKNLTDPWHSFHFKKSLSKQNQLARRPGSNFSRWNLPASKGLGRSLWSCGCFESLKVCYACWLCPEKRKSMFFKCQEEATKTAASGNAYLKKTPSDDNWNDANELQFLITDQYPECWPQSLLE